MSTMHAAHTMATPATAARVRVQSAGHGTWLSPVQYASTMPSADINGNGTTGFCTKRPPRRLEQRLT